MKFGRESLRRSIMIPISEGSLMFSFWPRELDTAIRKKVDLDFDGDRTLSEEERNIYNNFQEKLLEYERSIGVKS